MAKTKTMNQTARELHGALIEVAKPGGKVPRDRFDFIVMSYYDIGYPQALHITRSGERLRLWKRHRGEGSERVNPGWVELLPPTDNPMPPQEEEGESRPEDSTTWDDGLSVDQDSWGRPGKFSLDEV